MTRRLLVVAGLVALALPLAAEERSLFFETFDETLDPEWRWLGSAEERRRLEDGRLHIRTAPGGIHARDARLTNLLIRELPRADEKLCVEVEIWNRPVTLYENAGLMLYLDNDNYVRVNKESFEGHLDPPVILQVVSEIDGEFHDDRHRVTYARDAPVSLRMRIDPETVTAFYRRARTGPWIEFGAIPRPVAGRLWIGIETSYGEEGADRWAEFDDFQVVAGC